MKDRMKKSNKDTHILFRLSKEEKAEFESVCNENGYIMSRVLRVLMADWVEEETKKIEKNG